MVERTQKISEPEICLVTGGAGFIGCAVSAELVKMISFTPETALLINFAEMDSEILLSIIFAQYTALSSIEQSLSLPISDLLRN